MRKKRGTQLGIKDLALPALALPYVFWGIYLFEEGVNAMSLILGVVLLLIVPGVLAVFWKKL